MFTHQGGSRRVWQRSWWWQTTRVGILLVVMVMGIAVVAMMGGRGVPSIVQAAPERPIMAFYYPWYEMSDWSRERMSDLPDPLYSSGDDKVIMRHIQQAEDAGINAFICTWFGPNEDRIGSRCEKLQSLAEKHSNLQIAIIPDHAAWESLRSVDALVEAVNALESDFMTKPNYLHFQGKPVVFWFHPPSLPGGLEAWKQVRDRADPNREQFWFGGTDDFDYLQVYDTLYYFDITWESSPGVAMASYNRRLADRAPFIATVIPGYDDILIRNGHSRDREGGTYYRGTWQDAIKYDADAVVLVSFNEFLEGSHIEPSENFGDLYLTLTAELSAQFRQEVGGGGSISNQPTQPEPTEEGLSSRPTTEPTEPSDPNNPKAEPTEEGISSRSTPNPTIHPTITPSPQPSDGEGTSCEKFPATGYTVCGRLLEYWRQNGGLPVFGYPISPQQEELIEGEPFQVQHFERNRLELHPENDPPFDVLLGRLGVDILEHNSRSWWDFDAVDGADSECVYFEATRHSLCEPFLSYWQNHGLELNGQQGYNDEESKALFGLPVSEQIPETLSDGNEYTVQWFERARFEHHPKNEPPFDVLLGLLGKEMNDDEE